MPKQEVFFEQVIGDRRVEVLKSYDESYAREAFKSMNDDGLAFLWKTLKPEEIFEPAGLPKLGDDDAEDFLWDELLVQAREYGEEVSFFIVNDSSKRPYESIYVSPDWPSAEAFAKAALAGTDTNPS